MERGRDYFCKPFMRSKIINYALAILCVLVACHVAQKAPKSKNLDALFDKQGHRGCRGLMPENTIPAMKRAMDLGVTTLEMDVVITKDAKVVGHVSVTSKV